MKKNTLRVLNRFICFISGITLFWSCESNDYIKIDDKEYYPLERGRYWVYEVKDDKYSLTEKPVHSTYWFKETVGDAVADESGNSFYRMIRLRKNTKAGEWKADSAWLIRRLPDKVIRIEDNIVFTKLVFPVEKGSKWNANSYNTIDKVEELTYARVREEYFLTNKKYPITLTVSKIRDSTALAMDRKIEVYAYNTGLIRKENANLNYCDDPSCIGSGKIDFGQRTLWTLIETGKE